MSTKRTVAGTAGVLALLLATAGAVHGQACIGVPIPQGSMGAHASVGFTDGANMYAASFTQNMPGPLAVGGGYTLTSFDGGGANMHGLGVRASYDLPFAGLPIAACAAGGLSLSRWSESEGGVSVTLNALHVPIGAGVAYPVEATPDLGIVPFLLPHVLVMRTSFTIDGVGEGFDGTESDTSTEFALRLGSGFSFQSFFGAIEVFRILSISDADNVFTLSFGYRF